MADFNYLSSCLRAYEESTIDLTFSPDDAMVKRADTSGKIIRVSDEEYLAVGKSAVESILTGLSVSEVQRVRRVLDLPCGHGRVLRHLVKLFPDAEFDACDIDRSGVSFCASTFGANPIQSDPELTKVRFPPGYDLIWVGSLFTHTPRVVTKAWMRHLASFLGSTGILVATFHGRWCETAHSVMQYIAPDGWATVLQGFHATGYGYADYNTGRVPADNGPSFGVSLARASAIVEDLETIPGVRILHYRERGWGDHQDVAVIGRPGVDEPWPWA